MEYLIPLWAHQSIGVERASQRENFAFFYEVRCGKTATFINTLRHKMNQQKKFLRTLILTPPIVISNFSREFSLHSKIPQDKIFQLAGSGKDRLKTVLKQGFDGSGSPQGAIFITNFEALQMEDLYEAFQRWQPEVLAVDESHKIKNPTAKRTKLLARLANGVCEKDKCIHPPIANRYLLSGTPVLNSPLDLFSQYLVMDGGATFGNNYFIFRATYFYDRNAGMPKQKYFPDWQIKPGALAAISEKIASSSMRVEKKDVLKDLPPFEQVTLKVPMDPDQRRLYDQMKKEFITFLESGEAVVATLAITKALRLMQICSGYVKTDTGKEVGLKKTPKQKILTELLEELTPHSKVIIWAVFKENYAQIRAICDELKIGCVELHGGTTPAQRVTALTDFAQSPDCRVFIGHPGSGGIGISLVAPYCIFYSRTFSLEQSLQSEARNHDTNAKHFERITRFDLVCENSIEEIVQEKLASKKEVSDTILRSEILLSLKKH